MQLIQIIFFLCKRSTNPNTIFVWIRALFDFEDFCCSVNVASKGWFPYNRSRSLLIASDCERLMAILWKHFPAITHDRWDRKCSILAIVSDPQRSFGWTISATRRSSAIIWKLSLRPCSNVELFMHSRTLVVIRLGQILFKTRPSAFSNSPSSLYYTTKRGASAETTVYIAFSFLLFKM